MAASFFNRMSLSAEAGNISDSLAHTKAQVQPKTRGSCWAWLERVTLQEAATFRGQCHSDRVETSIGLGHGDMLVMDGLARDELEHCTTPGLEGCRIHLTNHSGCATLAFAVPCSLPSGVKGLPPLDFVGGAEGSWGLSCWTGISLLLGWWVLQTRRSLGSGFDLIEGQDMVVASGLGRRPVHGSLCIGQLELLGSWTAWRVPVALTRGCSGEGFE